MDVSGIAAAATEMAQARTVAAVQVSVLKKAIDIQSEGAMRLIESTSQVITNNTLNLGNKVDTFA